MSENLGKRLLLKNNLSQAWNDLLMPIVEKDEFYLIIEQLVRDSPKFAPSVENIFAAMRHIEPDQVRVIMLGQDPYPQPDIATGIAFANQLNVPTLSPSLSVILDELIESNEVHNEFTFFNNSDLIHWSEQGVLLLNSSLTVKHYAPSSHKKLWKPFMLEFLPKLDKPDLIVVMTGNQAGDFSHCFTKAKYKFKVPHPAADTYNNSRKFRGSEIFTKINKTLVNMCQSPISWQGKLK